MREIPLANGRGVALVDDDDFERASAHRWYLHTKGYAYAPRRSGTLLMHRVVMNAPRGLHVDHEHGNKLDNRKSELRLCTRTQNNCNSKKPRRARPATSQYKGVSWVVAKLLWHACMSQGNRTVTIGFSKDETEAALLYDAAVRRVRGEFGTYNFPLPGERSALRAPNEQAA